MPVADDTPGQLSRRAMTAFKNTANVTNFVLASAAICTIIYTSQYFNDERIINAWQVLVAAKEKPYNIGQKASLEYLVRKQVSLRQLSLGCGKEKPLPRTQSLPVGYCHPLDGADLTGADFSLADLSGANLGNARLAGANFFRADLTNVSFIGADLTGTRFTNAILAGVHFMDAHLARADFTGADLTGARFVGKTMEQDGKERERQEAHGLEREQLVSACAAKGSLLLPPEIKSPERAMACDPDLAIRSAVVSQAQPPFQSR